MGPHIPIFGGSRTIVVPIHYPVDIPPIFILSWYMPIYHCWFVHEIPSKNKNQHCPEPHRGFQIRFVPRHFITSMPQCSKCCANKGSWLEALVGSLDGHSSVSPKHVKIANTTRNDVSDFLGSCSTIAIWYISTVKDAYFSHPGRFLPSRLVHSLSPGVVWNSFIAGAAAFHLTYPNFFPWTIHLPSPALPNLAKPSAGETSAEATGIITRCPWFRKFYTFFEDLNHSPGIHFFGVNRFTTYVHPQSLGQPASHDLGTHPRSFTRLSSSGA